MCTRHAHPPQELIRPIIQLIDPLQHKILPQSSTYHHLSPTPPAPDVDFPQHWAMNRITMLPTKDLDYHLPPHLIATDPTPQRDAARLLVLSRSNPAILEHHHFSDLPSLLLPNDNLILNNTRVLPARLQGYRADTKGKIEGLYLDSTDTHTWHVMLKSNSKLQPNQQITLTNPNDQSQSLTIKLISKDDAIWTVQALTDQPTESILAQIGLPPLPPYILKARRNRASQADSTPSHTNDQQRYQTVYAGHNAGAVAAPTAGLHFTDQLLEQCKTQGITQSQVTLHVGAGTFKPVDEEFLQNHPMHSEWFTIPPETLQQISQTQEQGGRNIAVGTTSVRTIESIPNLNSVDLNTPISQSTNLLIAPGFNFQHTDALLTNFHLPCSTLLALVAAFLNDQPPLPRLHEIYQIAIQAQYRFYSYGDAMLILP